jgi:hypothetical protein
MVSCREVGRERAGSGIEPKTSLGNKKKTDTHSWHWVIRKRQTHINLRERADSGIELKTSLGNKKKTDTHTWHWVIRKRQTNTDFAFQSTAQT